MHDPIFNYSHGYPLPDGHTIGVFYRKNKWLSY